MRAEFFDFDFAFVLPLALLHEPSIGSGSKPVMKPGPDELAKLREQRTGDGPETPAAERQQKRQK